MDSSDTDISCNHMRVCPECCSYNISSFESVPTLLCSEVLQPHEFPFTSCTHGASTSIRDTEESVNSTAQSASTKSDADSYEISNDKHSEECCVTTDYLHDYDCTFTQNDHSFPRYIQCLLHHRGRWLSSSDISAWLRTQYKDASSDLVSIETTMWNASFVDFCPTPVYRKHEHSQIVYKT
jgi:hypothetical protein